MDGTEHKIGKVFEMLYPYGDYSGDVAFTCIAIERALRETCESGMKHVLLLIGRYLGHRFKPDDKIDVICQKIKDEILSLCFSQDLTDVERAKVIMGLTGRTLPHLTDVQLGCKSFAHRFNNPLDTLIRIKRFPNIWTMLSEYKRTRGEVEQEENRSIEDIWSNRINLFEGWRDILNLLNQGKFLEVFERGLRESGMVNLNESTQKYPLNKREVEFLNNIITQMLNGQLDVFATWNNICR